MKSTKVQNPRRRGTTYAAVWAMCHMRCSTPPSTVVSHCGHTFRSPSVRPLCLQRAECTKSDCQLKIVFAPETWWSFPFGILRFPFLVSRFLFPISRFSFSLSRFPFLISRLDILGYSPFHAHLPPGGLVAATES